jgi:ACS family pantothenate transporter-like MFS transporter
MDGSDLTIVPAEYSNEQSKKTIESTAVHPVVEAREVSTKSSWGRYLVGLVWDSVDGDPRNRRYVQKLDSFLLYALDLFLWVPSLRLTTH